MPSRIQHADIDLLARLFKGELTMGDHVIGTTPGGFKIHASRGPSHEGYAGMKSGDHIVAANMHAKAARDLNIKATQMGGSMTLKRQAANHLHLATTHREAGSGTSQKLAASFSDRSATMHASVLYADVLRKANGGEGSRGGSIIGHTRSGKPIYSHDHASNAKVIAHSPASGGNDDAKEGRNRMRAVTRAHGNYSHKDHQDAADLHEKNSKKDGDLHHRLFSAHAMASGFLEARGKGSSQMPR